MSLIEREKSSFRNHPVRSSLIWLLLLVFVGMIFWLMNVGGVGIASTLFETREQNFAQKLFGYCLPFLPIVAWFIVIKVSFSKDVHQAKEQNKLAGRTNQTLGEILGEAMGDRDDLK